MNINLHIERLMLDGLSVASGQAALVQTAVEAELGRLLANELFAPAESSSQAHLGGGEIHLRASVSARELGIEIGRSVFARLLSDGLGQATSVAGLSAHNLPRTSKAHSPLGSGNAHEESVSSNRFGGVNPENVHNNHSMLPNEKGK
ncbi:MAG TPA: hypothetical protein VH254_04785 [Candidatus Udaeobacter sp.]|jgi:hypothetical protein|nr:hypothetical protein [Candidatus Udaeobacter sp.]